MTRNQNEWNLLSFEGNYTSGNSWKKNTPDLCTKADECRQSGRHFNLLYVCSGSDAGIAVGANY